MSPIHAQPRKDNDNSCVVLIEGQGGRMLLTGDISAAVEPQVAQAVGRGSAPVMLVPHHGSKTSSSATFIRAVQPRFVVVSAGWRNRFGHPRPEVVTRYARAGVPMFNTATEGAIPLVFPADKPPRREPGWRLQQPRYWRE